MASRLETAETNVPRAGRRGGRRVLLVVGIAIVLCALLAETARALEDPLITSQAKTANARFLAYAPPPPVPGAVCIVDSGLDLNPDTAPNVLERIALDGGDPGDVDPTKHGTRMAMVAGGQTNGWGSVGIWPHLRVVSVRAMPAGASGFAFGHHYTAINRCKERSGMHPIRAINVSLGTGGLDPQEITRLIDTVVDARIAGLNLVAAAGNGGGPIDYPAAIRDAFAVAAGDKGGAFCSFSARDAGLDIAAPGCELETARADGTPAWSSGTSEAAALTSAVLVALRSYRPTLSARAAEELLVQNARATTAGKMLDAEAAFRAAGLVGVVDAGNAAAQAADSAGVVQVQPQTSGNGGGNPYPTNHGDRHAMRVRGVDQNLPKPRIGSSQLHGRRLSLRLANRPNKAMVDLTVRYATPHGEFRTRAKRSQRRSSTVTLLLPDGWTAIELAYRGADRPMSRRLVVKKRSFRPSV